MCKFAENGVIISVREGGVAEGRELTGTASFLLRGHLEGSRPPSIFVS